MQNIVNYLCPFFGYDGKPIVNGRVYFVKPETSAQTFEELSGLDAADFVTVKDKDGTALANPLSLDSLGRFSSQPFVDEETDFKMIVCYPTGVSPQIHDETPSWDIAYTVFSKYQGVSVELDGIATVPSLAALRQLDPSVKSAIVLGYGTAGDFCPPRVFNWVNSVTTDDGGMKIRSSVTGHTADGTWILTPGDYVDVRWFGIAPDMNDDCSATVAAIASAYTTMPIYFPKGDYYLSTHVSLKSVIIDRLAIFYPLANENIAFTVSDGFENRGGYFGKDENDHIVYPKLRGVLRASWLTSPIDAALSSSALANVDEIMFDKTVTTYAAVTVSKKRVLVKDGVTFPSTVTLAPSCHVYYENGGKVCAGLAKLGEDWNIEPDDTAEVAANRELKVSKGVTLLAKFKASLIEFFTKVKMGFGFVVDADNAWQSYDNAQSDWNGQLVLVVQKLFATVARISSAAIESLVATAASVKSCVVENAVYKSEYLMMVGDGKIQYIDDEESPPYTETVQSSANVFIDECASGYWELPEGAVIHVFLKDDASYSLCFPSEAVDRTYVIHKPLNQHNTTFVEVSDDSTESSVTVLSIVKALGLVSLNAITGQNFSRAVVRAPTNAERTRYGIAATEHWIIDTFAL